MSGHGRGDSCLDFFFFKFLFSPHPFSDGVRVMLSFFPLPFEFAFKNSFGGWLCFLTFLLLLDFRNVSEFATMISLLQLFAIIVCVSRFLLSAGCSVTVIWILTLASAEMVSYYDQFNICC